MEIDSYKTEKSRWYRQFWAWVFIGVLVLGFLACLVVVVASVYHADVDVRLAHSLSEKSVLAQTVPSPLVGEG